MATQPTKIGKYKIIAQIGKGGMGAVFKAEHPTLKRSVIIKKLTLTDNKDFVERFRREAQLMMEFRNEKIVQVYDHFKEGDSYHIVMEFVDGITLEDLIGQRRFLSEEASLLIFSEVCKALKYAHDRQIIHRDIKPANILISNEGKVKLVDFGVSASLDRSEEDGLTKAGMTIGTPSYLAPEQIANAKNRDKRADIYSLGVLLYEMVIGKKPFRGGFTPEVIAMIEKGKYLPPKKVNPKIKSSVQRIIKKAMNHKVQKRYQDLSIVIKKTSKFLGKYQNQKDIDQAIKRCLEGKELQEPKSKGLFSKLSKKVVSFAVVLGVLVLIVGGSGFWLYQNNYHYEWLYPTEFGAFQVMVKVKKGHKTADEIYTKALLFKEQGNSLKQVKNVELSFRELRELESKNFFTLGSQKVFLKQDTYKLVLYVENEQFRENFYLNPRIIQNTDLSTVDGLKIAFSSSRQLPQLAVNSQYKVFDLHSGKNISSGAEVSALIDGEWRNWKDLSTRNRNGLGFYSGKRYRIRFKHQDYITKYYNLTIHPEQTNVSVNIKMTPVPATLLVKSSLDDVKLLINGSEHYVSGDLDRKLMQIDPIGKKESKFVLSPGQYDLSAEHGMLFFKKGSKSAKVRLQSKEQIHVTINQDSAGDQLQFNIE